MRLDLRFAAATYLIVSGHRILGMLPRLLLLMCTLGATFGVVADISPMGQLKWLDSTTAEQSFRKDRDAKKYRFYVVYGYSPDIVGIGNLTYSRCYRGVVELVSIEGTNDALINEEHKRLNDLAEVFAGEYNRLMQQHVDSLGLRTCPPAADWNAMLSALTDYVWGSTQLEGQVRITLSGPPTITIDLKDVKRVNDVSRFTCQTIQTHGINELVLVKVNEWLPPPGYNSREIEAFSCVQGRINR